MIYSRRQLLGAGLSAGFVATAAQGQTLAQIVAGLKDPAPTPLPVQPLTRGRRSRPAAGRWSTRSDRPAPARPRPRLVRPPPLAAPPHRRRRDRRFQPPVGRATASSCSTPPPGRVSNHLVAHGRGSDPVAQRLAPALLQRDRLGSLARRAATSPANIITANTAARSASPASTGATSNAETRAIVVHSAWYAEPEQLAAHGKLGRSRGLLRPPLQQPPAGPRPPRPGPLPLRRQARLTLGSASRHFRESGEGAPPGHSRESGEGTPPVIPAKAEIPLLSFPALVRAPAFASER